MLIDPLFIYTSNDTAPPTLPQATGGMMMVQAGYIRTSRYRYGMRNMMWKLQLFWNRLKDLLPTELKLYLDYTQ